MSATLAFNDETSFDNYFPSPIALAATVNIPVIASHASPPVASWTIHQARLHRSVSCLSITVSRIMNSASANDYAPTYIRILRNFCILVYFCPCKMG